MHDALHLHLGETIADAEVATAPKRNPAVRVLLAMSVPFAPRVYTMVDDCGTPPLVTGIPAWR